MVAAIQNEAFVQGPKTSAITARDCNSSAAKWVILMNGNGWLMLPTMVNNGIDILIYWWY